MTRINNFKTFSTLRVCWPTLKAWNLSIGRLSILENSGINFPNKPVSFNIKIYLKILIKNFFKIFQIFFSRSWFFLFLINYLILV